MCVRYPGPGGCSEVPGVPGPGGSLAVLGGCLGGVKFAQVLIPLEMSRWGMCGGGRL